MTYGSYGKVRPVATYDADRYARWQANKELIWRHFGADDLRRICTMRERTFIKAFDMQAVDVPQGEPADWYGFKDNGSDILAVAHLDTVQPRRNRDAHFVETADGWVVYSGALDDRLGAYTILDLLPKLGLTFDWLVTVGEESGASTAAFFEPPIHKDYKWIIEFDRGGSDVVMYEYEDSELAQRVADSGATVGSGSLSDISYMQHVGRKAINWGVGYKDYHGPRSHAFLEDYVGMLARFLEFHAVNKDTRMEHEEDDWRGYGSGSYGSASTGLVRQSTGGGWYSPGSGEGWGYPGGLRAIEDAELDAPKYPLIFKDEDEAKKDEDAAQATLLPDFDDDLALKYPLIFGDKDEDATEPEGKKSIHTMTAEEFEEYLDTIDPGEDAAEVIDEADVMAALENDPDLDALDDDELHDALVRRYPDVFRWAGSKLRRKSDPVKG